MSIFIKKYYVDVESDITSIMNEIELQNKSSNFGFSPKIIRHYQSGNEYIIEMEKINGMILADFYGENMSDLPASILCEVKRILKTLLYSRIQYIDITPYNFMIEEGTDKIYIIDFEHALPIYINWYVRDFLLEGKLHEWNEDFE
jgi:tRNA A-37 threonylcarbamoyl transferase component Bud32